VSHVHLLLSSSFPNPCVSICTHLYWPAFSLVGLTGRYHLVICISHKGNIVGRKHWCALCFLAPEKNAVLSVSPSIPFTWDSNGWLQNSPSAKQNYHCNSNSSHFTIGLITIITLFEGVLEFELRSLSLLGKCYKGLNHAFSPFCSGYFGDRVSLFAQSS
jgi:hypothetical protein